MLTASHTASRPTPDFAEDLHEKNISFFSGRSHGGDSASRRPGEAAMIACFSCRRAHNSKTRA
jgi:hypothetical protein